MKYVIHMAALATLCIVGCATTQPTPELDQARSEVAQVANEPTAREAAGVTLKKAQDSLAIAEQSAKEHKSPDIIRQEAYIASRQAQIAMEQIKEARARKEVEQGEAERNRVLLEARTSEANRAVSEAERAKAEAQSQLAQATAARGLAEAARSDAETARAEAERLKQEMSELQAKQTERGMVLTLGDVLFDTGRAELKPGATATLNRLSEFLHNHMGYKVLIEGHTDSVGSDEYNIGLSQRRAEAVASALAARGVEPGRVRTRGLGKHYPVASNDTAAGRQQNRRVEIVFSDDKGTFSPSAERTVS